MSGASGLDVFQEIVESWFVEEAFPRARNSGIPYQ